MLRFQRCRCDFNPALILRGDWKAWVLGVTSCSAESMRFPKRPKASISVCPVYTLSLIPFAQLQTPRGRGVAGFGGVGGSPVKHKHPKSQSLRTTGAMEPGSTASGKM